MITSLAINSLTIGTLASGYVFTKFSGFGFPNVDVDVKERGNYHGARLNSFRYSRRLMSVELEIQATSTSDYETKRIALFKALDLYSGLSTLTITTKSGTVLTADVIVTAEVGEEYKRGDIIVSPVRIEFTAPYPFLLGSTTNSTTVYVFSGGGFAIPFSIPFDMSQGGTNATVIANNGNGKAFPTIKIYGIIENPSIQNLTTGESLSLNYTLTSISDYIEIDTYNRTVKLNGITNIKKYATGDFLCIASGNNTFKLTASSSGSGARAVVSYKHAYLGI